MSTASDRMILIGFLQAQNCSNYPGAWRHPAATGDFMTRQYYQRIARTLEDAKFDMAFFDDRLAMPEIYGESHDMAVRHGIRTVKMEPSTWRWPWQRVASAWGPRTRRRTTSRSTSPGCFRPWT